MSGRLVILPHKSWNVWNQDNREKVARDERLHREAEEAKAEKAKLLLQEQNLEQLLSNQNPILLVNDGSIATSSSSVVPFRLFEDLEKTQANKIGNAEYIKEKAQKEQAQKKKDGVADWALGEGSYENSKTKPWYAVLDQDNQSSTAATIKLEAGLTGASSSNKLVREITRKVKADPMSNLLHVNQFDYQPKYHGEKASEYHLDSIESKEPERTINAESDSESASRKNHKKHKKRHREEDRKSESKRSKHHRHNTKEGKEEDTSGNRRRNDLVIQNPTKSPHTAPSVDNSLAGLRQKRLEREAVEKKRAAMLLASVDIYGAGNSSGSGSSLGPNREYSQQYNPHLARAYKR